MVKETSINEALKNILVLAAQMATTGISEDINEWKLPKTTPLKAKRKICQEAEKWNDIQRGRAIILRDSYNILSKHCR